MQMTKSEIVADYQAAKDPKKQIGILADLNQTTKAEIVSILREAGEPVRGNYAHATRKDDLPGPPPAELIAAPEAEETVSLRESLPMLIRAAAVDTIARLLHSADRKEEQPHTKAIGLQEQVRGVLALVDEIDRRCDAMAEDGEEEEP